MKIRFKKKYVFLLLYISLFFIYGAFCKYSLHQLSIFELKSFISQSATRQDIKSLGQNLFSFEIDTKSEDNIISYVKLQKAVADKIPHEYSRPVISLRVVWNDSAKITRPRTVGVLGGMGPLSDSNLIKLIVKNLSKVKKTSSVIIHLFSIPPPRSIWEQVTGGLTYILRVRQFLQSGYANYYLASNTAHIYYKQLKIISGHNRITHLPKMIVTTIKNSSVSANNTILILGSKLAWKNKLYDKLTVSESVLTHRLEAIEQDSIQSWIQKVKEGRLDNDQTDLLFNFVIKLAKKYNTTNLLLSCTELTLALNKKRYMFKHLGYQIFNSEQMLVDLIVNFLAKESA